MIFATALSLGARAGAATVTYYACVNNSTGAPTIVTATTTCKSGHSKISWNEVGPTGPAGKNGTNGTNGTNGAQGIQGPPGLAVGYFAACGYDTTSECGSSDGILSTSGPVLILQTKPVDAPTNSYYLIWASTNFASGYTSTTYEECFITSAANYPETSMTSIGGQGYATLSNTDVFYLVPGDVIQLWCQGSPISGSEEEVDSASLSAIQMDSMLVGNTSNADNSVNHKPFVSKADRKK